MGKAYGRIQEQDVVFGLARYRLPFEHVVKRRGSNGIGKYGLIIAEKWLRGLGISTARRWRLIGVRGTKVYPDLFDPSTRVAYEVKTGHLNATKAFRVQARAYRRVVNTRQALKVVYLNVAISGRVGPSFVVRSILKENGLDFMILN